MDFNITDYSSSEDLNSKLSDIISTKSLLISSLYDFAKSFEKFEYPGLQKDIIYYTVMHIKELYHFDNAIFINYDEANNSYFIKGGEVAYRVYDIKPFETNDILKFAHKTMNITIKIFNQRIHSQISDLEISTTVYIPIHFKKELFGFIMLESEKVLNLNSDDISIISIIASQMGFALKNAQLIETVESNFLSTVNSLVSAIEIKDIYTKGHSSRVAKYTINFAFFLNLPKIKLKSLEISALLHDIGKIGIPSELLNKKEKLSISERDLIKKHPEMGEHILAPLNFLGSERIIIRHHHEKWDGSGYPDNLKGDMIPFESRLLSLSDALDAMATDRPYRTALKFPDIIKEFEIYRGTQFDPELATKFIEFLEINQHLLRRDYEN
ncbi:MAG: HD domain-containing protein [Spirochaetes bacterium]|nr:HD domain-containing protein [Spirochaetota bacterium]NLJ04687.1 HD domain-containing protein [Exilispira sp.]HOV45473.1 HD domain-containing phosphohydrolase [Exilispira sp.]HPO60271.1 HD domain-containing phosphohydrolase [Exilispira sp.]